MKKLWRWFWRQAFFRFAVVGGAGYLVNATALAPFTNQLHFGVDAALAKAIFVAMCFSLVTERANSSPAKNPI